MRFILVLAINVCVGLQTGAAIINDTPQLFDRFSHIRCMEEITRLDNYARALKAVPNGTAVIIGYGGRRDTKRGEITARLLGISGYLIKNGEIDKNRIIILDGGYREELNLELWIIPNREDAALLINSTVQSKDVKFKKGTLRKWGYRCKVT